MSRFKNSDSFSGRNRLPRTSVDDYVRRRGQNQTIDNLDDAVDASEIPMERPDVACLAGKQSRKQHVGSLTIAENTKRTHY
jgi:hypothetical protein